MRRVGAWLLTVGLLLSLTACRARVDLTQDPLQDDTTPTNGVTVPSPERDEMAQHAWEIYSAAVEAEQSWEQYHVELETRSTLNGRLTVQQARLVRCVTDGVVELMIQTGEQQGYYRDGVGYYTDGEEKFWHVTDEAGFLKDMGFSESAPLSLLAFSDAVVIENPDGTRTVSCVLSGKFANDYAARVTGLSAAYVQANHVEVGVTVDADGQPQEFTSRLELVLANQGSLSLESSNRYQGVGASITIHAPDDLDTYVEGGTPF